MSSSSRSRFQRDPARVARRGKPLRRSESSSLFGTLKNIVTRPLSWFATDSKSEFADDSTNGKRRRVGDEPAPAQVDAGESAAASGDGRTKRMRLDSPDRTTASVDAPFNFQSQVYSPPQQQQGYLDPPRTAFQQMSFGHGSFSDMDTRMDTGTGRQTVSPRRALGRTMSMDPPAFPNSQSSNTPSRNYSRTVAIAIPYAHYDSGSRS
ncbi:hypothetical protein PLICRDRAFT_590129 [Plicaturopsis crispa FD-325 SS-3]|nr:hypothetical protein PLICRDRAFT_590129 [Plicaturopsis crispa FD-325 SS-3]